MRIRRRTAAAVLAGALGAAGVVAATGSPAMADAGACRPSYVSGGWDATVCINFNSLGESYGSARISSHPASCSYYRVYVYSHNTSPISTSARPCTTKTAQTIVIWPGAGGDSWAQLIAWNANGGRVLSINSPAAHV